MNKKIAGFIFIILGSIIDRILYLIYINNIDFNIYIEIKYILYFYKHIPNLIGISFIIIGIFLILKNK